MMSKIRNLIAAVAFSFSSVLAAAQSAPSQQMEAAAVIHAMAAQFDKPESRLQVDPVVVADDYAIAGWTQGDIGGRALLKKTKTQWEIILCAGDALLTMATLEAAGTTSSTASKLVASARAAESKVDPARLAQFAKFEGLVMVSSGSHAHQPSHHK